MSKYRVIVFDLDGTLLDTSEGVLSSVIYTINKMALPLPEKDVLNTFIGPPVQRRFRELYHLDHKTAETAADIFRNHYKNIDLLKAVPYDGIYDSLEKIRERDIKIAVATYKRQDYTNTILHHFGFTQYTDNMYGSDFEGKLNKKDIIRLCIKHAGVTDYEQVLMVGDTMNDSIGAEQLGVDFLAVRFGFGFKTEDDLKDIKTVGSISHAAEIPNWIM